MSLSFFFFPPLARSGATGASEETEFVMGKGLEFQTPTDRHPLVSFFSVNVLNFFSSFIILIRRKLNLFKAVRSVKTENLFCGHSSLPDEAKQRTAELLGVLIRKKKNELRGVRNTGMNSNIDSDFRNHERTKA